MVWHVCYTKPNTDAERQIRQNHPIRNALHPNYAGPFSLTPLDARPLAMGVTAGFMRDSTPWIEPPSFAPADEVVISPLAAETEITLEA